MENPMGFAHFLAQSDFVARGVLALMLLASIGTWTLIATKGFRLWRVQRQSASFLSAFWAAPNLEAVAARIRENGANEPFSHLVHHGFTAIEQNNRRLRGEAGTTLIDSGAPDDLLTRALKRAIDEDRSRLEFGQTLLATVASAAPAPTSGGASGRDDGNENRADRRSTTKVSAYLRLKTKQLTNLND